MRPVPPTTAKIADSTRKMFAKDHASLALGIEVLEAEQGRATVSMPVTAAMVNGHALAHGGYVFLLADTAFACACNSEGPITVAAGAEITFVAPARQGDLLHASAEERTRFGRNGIYDITVRDAQGRVIAEFRGHSRRVEREEESPP